MTFIRSKYGAKPTIVDGIRFASRKEANYYCELKQREMVNSIRDLELQPKFPIVILGKPICTYIADFQFYDCWTKKVRVVDVKGIRTSTYRLKKKLMEAVYPELVIEEV